MTRSRPGLKFRLDIRRFKAYQGGSKGLLRLFRTNYLYGVIKEEAEWGRGDVVSFDLPLRGSRQPDAYHFYKDRNQPMQPIFVIKYIGDDPLAGLLAITHGQAGRGVLPCQAPRRALV